MSFVLTLSPEELEIGMRKSGIPQYGFLRTLPMDCVGFESILNINVVEVKELSAQNYATN